MNQLHRNIYPANTAYLHSTLNFAYKKNIYQAIFSYIKKPSIFHWTFLQSCCANYWALSLPEIAIT